MPDPRAPTQACSTTNWNKVVLPLFYSEPAQWRAMMKQSIGHIGYYFNSQRMMRRYASEAYLR